ncbi:DotH/IcmK family type IV secretion protein [Vibrio splendidus]|nr:DotH/IcmK family type IV secretion protein [Vibrio splendidus]MCC4883258.1 DotH/IcmK family type IV secretion protein [Vibrio splendidus]
MKNKLGLIALSVSVALSASASVSANMDPGVAPATPPPPQHERNIKFMTNAGELLAADFTQQEIEILSQKKDVLIKYLYEQEQLENLRGILDNKDRKESWQAEKEAAYPLTPSEILELRAMALKLEESKNKPLENIKNEIRSVTLDVGASEPVTINVVKGLASSIVFYDETGAPWPIEGEIIGDMGAFKKHTIGDRKNIAVFEVLRNFAESNALVHLKGLDVSIVVRLVGSEHANDSRLSVRIPKPGPHAQFVPVSSPSIGNTDPLLTSVANGNFLQGSKRFEIVGVDGTVFYKNGYLYMRTKHKLILPLPKEAQTTPSGYMVYKVPAAEDFLFLIDGKMVEATIEEAFDVKIKQKSSLFK